MICDNLKIIFERIEKAKNKFGRKDEIKLVTVTKTVLNDKIKEAISCGITDIGENRVQEAERKVIELPELSKIKKHLIGHLQTNKAKKAVEIFDLIQSVDSIHLLSEINKRSQQIGKIQDCLIEIKVSEEDAKTGLNLDGLEDFLNEAKSLANIRILGLMAMAPFFDDPELARPYFRQAKKVFLQFADRFSLVYLSMGMTNDFEVAIEEGSNMVRIGTGIFGERK